ncbi:hypothetical protein ACTG9Q_21635 [Actinokineospora sp. 24-640]
MGLVLRKLIELILPKLVKRIGSRVVYWAFGICTGIITWLFVVPNGPFGLAMALGPLLLVWRTARAGLNGVGPITFGMALSMTLFPAFFLGLYRSDDSMPSGFVLAGFLTFLVWVATFPAVLDHLDRAHLRRGPGMADLPPGPNPAAAARLLVVRLWMATVIMLVVGEGFAALICLFALAYHARWSAALAALACLVIPLLSFEYGDLVWDADLLAVAAALVAADQWRAAAVNPDWRGGLLGSMRRRPRLA